MAETNETLPRVPHVAGLAHATMKLIDALKGGKPGDEIPDDDYKGGGLLGICGKPTAPGRPGYGNLQSAIRHCERVYKVVWRRIAEGGCIRCLTPDEAVNLTGRYAKQATRTARRGIRVAGTVDPETLSGDETKREHRMRVAQLGALAVIGSERGYKRMVDRGNGEAPKVDAKRLIDGMFKTAAGKTD
jgi:hypothetical protein